MQVWDDKDGSQSSSQSTPDSDSAPGADKAGEPETRASRALQEQQGGRSGYVESGNSDGGGPSKEPRHNGHRRRLAMAPTKDLSPAYMGSGTPLREPVSDQEPLDLKKYLRVLIKQRWLIVGIAAFALCIGLIYTLLQTPIYRGSATIEIRREVANLSGVAGIDEVDSGPSGEFYQTQYELLKSRALAERIVAKLRLGERPDFLQSRKSPLSQLKGLLIGARQAGNPDPKPNQDRAIGMVQSGLRVEPVRSSRVVRVSYDSPSPKFAQEVANGAVNAFVEMSLERSYEASGHARRFLQDRLEDLKLKLEDSERKLVDYAKQKDILTTGDDSTLTLANLEETNSALSAASKKRLKNELIWKQMEGSDALPQSLESEAVAALRAKRADLLIDYQEKLKVFKSGYPDMLKLRAQISEIEQQIQNEVERIKESMQMEYAAAREEEDSLVAQLVRIKQEVSDYQERNIDYTILKREVDTNRTLYDGLLQRYKELSVAGGGGNPSNISILDKAQRPGGPYKPDLKTNLAFALFFGVVSGGLAAFGREFIDDSFTAPEEVEQELGLPVLGVIPRVDEGDLEKQFADPRSALNEAYRSLRTALQFTAANGVPRTLLVTSSRPSEGKSSTAIGIARHFALLGMRVLLIDADLRKPSLHIRLGCVGYRGLSNCLVGNASPPDVLQRTDYPNLEFMPAGPVPPDPTELLASSQMATLLAIASEKYDLVVVDSAPVGGMADAPVLSNYTDGTILVVEAHGALRGGVVNALKRLHFSRADVLGVVLNKFSAKFSSYGYGYGAGEYYNYGGNADVSELDRSVTEALDHENPGS
ncbi:GumC family protein [Amorphus sp. MBR-141]